MIFSPRSKNGKPVSPGFNKQIRDGNKYALVISETLPEDSGHYTCTATNPAGKAEKTIRLAVKGETCKIGLLKIPK